MAKMYKFLKYFSYKPVCVLDTTMQKVSVVGLIYHENVNGVVRKVHYLILNL